MSLFFILFLAAYGGMHLYAYMHLRQLCSSGSPRRWFALFLILMVLAPMGVRSAEHAGMPDLAVMLGWTGYCWMGFVFLLVVILGVRDCCKLTVRLFRSGKRTVPPVSRLRLALAPLAAFVCTVYGTYEAIDIRTERITVFSSRIAQPVRLVQLSDVHLGVMIGKWRLHRMLQAVADARPDVVVATGDVVDGQLHRMNRLAEQFGELRPKYGMFAVLGNHEYYAGLSSSLDFLRSAGFRVLRKESVQVLPSLIIAGVDDPAGARWGDSSGSDEKGLLPAGNERHFTLLLKHRPAIHPESKGRFDLQLSGHVHKGQIFPFNLLTYLFFPVNAGLNGQDDGSLLYVSRGTGTWGPPVRFLAPPEVTIIDIMPGSPR